MLALALSACADVAPDTGAESTVTTAPAETIEHVGTGSADTGTEPPRGALLFDTSVLHVIEIEVESQYLAALEEDRENRVPCTFTWDGTPLTEVGIRQKGFLGSSDTLDGKPGFSLKFDELVEGQRLDGMEKLLLNNAKEDRTFLSEHIGYAAYRAMGQPAAYTSHALVRFNGEAKGLYIVKEPVSSDFLERNFGEDNEDGNLYEGVYVQGDQELGDFVTHPDLIELKDEVEDGRSREDLIALGATIDQTPDSTFVDEVSARLDLSSYLTGLALDTHLGYWDSYAYFLNNYYLYHNPADDLFHYLPHGMDQLGYDEQGYPMGRFAIRIVEHPSLAGEFLAEKERVVAEWDEAAMIARIDAVESILHASGDLLAADRTDLAQFDRFVQGVRDDMTAIGQR